MAGEAMTTEALLEDARLASLAWDPGVEHLFRTAVTVAREAGDPAQLACAWAAVGRYLWERTCNEASVLAFASARREAGRAGDADGGLLALGGIYRSFAELGDLAGSLAAGLLLDDVSAEQWARIPRRLRRRLRQPEAVLEEAITRLREALPDFERRFPEGDLRFDRPEDVVAVFARRARHHETALAPTALGLERRAYRRQLYRRLAWPALPLMVLGAGLFWLEVSRGVLLFLVFPAVVLYVILWMAGVRAAWRWVKAHRAMSDTDHLFETLATDNSRHEEAVQILERFAKDRAPFVLYLRSFEGEAFEALTPKGVARMGSSKAEFVQHALRSGTPAGGYLEADRWVVSYQGSPTGVEAYLGEHLAPHLPVVTIANPAAQIPGRGHVPRFEVENDAWPVAVRLLMLAAHFIVIEPARGSPGVVQELELITSFGRQADTIVVLPSARSRTSMDRIREIGGAGFGEPVGPTAAFMGTGDAAVAAFARVVDDEAFGDLDPAELLVFRGLLPEELEPDPARYAARRRRRVAALHEAISRFWEGRASLDREEPDEAAGALEHAAEIFTGIDDAAHRALALNYLAKARQALGDLSEAARCFAAAAEIQQETGPPEEYIGSIHHLALVLLKTRALEEARTTFGRMQSASQRWGFRRGEARAIEGFGLCAIAAGDDAGAADHLRQALQMSDDPRDQASIAPLLASVEQRLGDYDAAASRLDTAAGAYGALGEVEAGSSALRDQIVVTHNAAVADLESGATAAAIDKLEQALEASRTHAATDLEQTILFRLGMAHSRAGRDAAALQFFRRSLALSRQAGDAPRVALAQSNIGAVLVRDGQIQDGIAALNEAEQWQRTNGKEGDLAYTVDALGDAYFRLNRREDSITWDEEALRLHRRQGNQRRAVDVLERLGLTRLQLGQYGEARAALLEVAEHLSESDAAQRLAAVLALAGQASARLGQAREAAQLFERSAVLLESLGEAAQAAQIRGLASSPLDGDSGEDADRPGEGRSDPFGGPAVP